MTEPLPKRVVRQVTAPEWAISLFKLNANEWYIMFLYRYTSYNYLMDATLRPRHPAVTCLKTIPAAAHTVYTRI